MKQNDFQTGLLIGLLISENQQQKAFIEMQREIIRLQQKVQELTPPQPNIEDVSFHLQTGTLSEEAANSADLREVEGYLCWVMSFAAKYVKPYVNQRVYQEVTTHMTRGLAERIAELETENMMMGGKKSKTEKAEKPKQLAFIS